MKWSNQLPPTHLQNYGVKTQGNLTWVVVQMLAMVDAAETVDKVAVAKEIVAEVPVQPCLGRHQRLVPAGI
jgi:hypothetical protein